MYDVEKQKAMNFSLLGEVFTICLMLTGVRFLGSGMQHILLGRKIKRLTDFFLEEKKEVKHAISSP